MNTPRGVKYLALVMRSVDGEELPKSTREDLAATADRAGTLKGKREVFCEGLRGIELYIMETKTGIKTRRYDAEKIRYILTAEFPSNIAEEVLAEVDTFINSLKLPR
jgi:hypothetical protein